jgi:hypothetical protein
MGICGGKFSKMMRAYIIGIKQMIVDTSKAVYYFLALLPPIAKARS